MTRFLPLLALLCIGWTFNWSNPVDRMGQPRGAFVTTPFPITEASTTYSFTNDESPNGKTFMLGTLYFVDGGAADDTGTGLTFGSPKKLVASALALAGSNVNATIIIRGAHDAFNGIYTTTHYLGDYAGQDDTHRMMLVGYGQERPFFTGSSSPDSMILRCYGQSTAPTNLYVTLQRLGFTNATATPVGFGYDGGVNKRAAYVNCIDLSGYDLGPDGDGGPLQGIIYYLNSDHSLISHCTVDRIQGHAFKVGDGASHDIVEWCYARDVGVRDGQLGYYNRSVAYDFPSDRSSPLVDTNKTLRYCFATNIVAYGVEVRRCQNIYIHHNELAGFGRGWGMTNMPGAEEFVAGNGIYILPGYGQIYGNKVFSTAPSNTSSCITVYDGAGVGQFDVWNNLTVGPVRGFYVQANNTLPVNLWNNTFVSTNASAAVTFGALAGAATNRVVNNIMAQYGSGMPGETLFHSVYPMHTNNLYFHPSGSAAEWGENGANEVTADPAWGSGFSVLSNSPAVGAGANLSSLFTDDINGITRGAAWDIGATENAAEPTPTGFVQQLNVGTLRIGP